MEWNTPRLSLRFVSLAKKPSTALIHDEEGDAEWKQLASIIADRNRPHKQIQRARIVLLSGEGSAVAEVARQAGVSRPAVWRWQVRYAEAGVEALLRDKTRPPGTPKLATATVAKILALTCSEPPGQIAH